MSIRSAVIRQIQQVAEQQGVALPPLTDDLPLVESGFDSLAIAILVATLEETVGLDPFTEYDDFPEMVTVGDFVRFYERTAECS
jgi:acyl carrier protein